MFHEDAAILLIFINIMLPVADGLSALDAGDQHQGTGSIAGLYEKILRPSEKESE
ncbi:hypothetical protein [Aliamphritea spongicola]|nr:hypothetical protein [Aliamphritea spongicola]